MIHVIRESIYVSLRHFTPIDVSLNKLKSRSWKFLSVYFLIFPAQTFIKTTLNARYRSVGRSTRCLCTINTKTSSGGVENRKKWEKGWRTIALRGHHSDSDVGWMTIRLRGRRLSSIIGWITIALLGPHSRYDLDWITIARRGCHSRADIVLMIMDYPISHLCFTNENKFS